MSCARLAVGTARCEYCDGFCDMLSSSNPGWNKLGFGSASQRLLSSNTRRHPASLATHSGVTIGFPSMSASMSCRCT
jgi:hypothetical protein